MPLLLNSLETEFLRALNRQNVRYLVIGGHAVVFHGYMRVIKDLDLWIDRSTENAEQVRLALSGMNAELSAEVAAKLTTKRQQLRIGGVNAELLTSIEGVASFEAAMLRSVKVYVEGEYVAVLGYDDLVANKTASGRDIDVEDVRELRAQRERSQ